MQIDLNHWHLFSIFFGLMLLLIFLMRWQGSMFYTKGADIRKFSMMELEIPATSEELVKIIKGMYSLPAGTAQKSVKALKTQLWLYFLFMPLAYGAIFLLCWRVGQKLHAVGCVVFIGLAFAQVIPFLCGIIGKIYLLNKIGPAPALNSPKQHTNYLRMEAVKWGVCLIAAVSGVSGVCYFWLTGNFSSHSLLSISIVVVEIVVFLLVSKLVLHPGKPPVAVP